jgi:hypothetical protein
MSRNFTNINNINYTNNTNNINDINTNDCSNEAIKEYLPINGPNGLASLPASQNIPPSGEVITSGVGNSPEVPRNWRGVKIDIFNNGIRTDGRASLKVNLGVIKNDGTTQTLTAAMNSPKSYVWRGVPQIDQGKMHWLLVKDIEAELKDIEYRASKFATPGKGSGTEVVGFLAETDDKWLVILAIKNARYEYWIPKRGTVTQEQKNKNLTASLYVGKSVKALLTIEDLGL